MFFEMLPELDLRMAHAGPLKFPAPTAPLA
jgi:hypothetical protein